MSRVRLGDLIDIITEHEDNPSQSKYDRFVGLEHYDAGEVVISRWGSTELLASAMKVFQPNDILVARRNVYLRRASVVNFAGLTSGDSIVIRAKDKDDEALLPFVLNTDSFWDFADRFADGTMSKRLSPKIMANFEFNMPSPDEKRRLAELLWAIHKTRVAYKELLQKTDDLVKSQFIEMFGDPVKNEMQWQTKSLEEACRIIVDCPHSTPNYTNEDTGFMCIRTSIVKKNRIVWDEIEYICEDEYNKRIQRKRPEKGDVVYTREGAILGIAAVIDRDCNVALGQRSMLLSPDTEQCTPEFLSAAMNCDTFLDNALKGQSGSASPHINVGDIKAFKMIMPPVEQQRQFSAFIQQADKSKLSLIKRLEELKFPIE